MKRLLSLASLLIAGCSEQTATVRESADFVLMNGEIYTMDAEQPWAEAVAVIDDRISFVGSNADAERWIGDMTSVVDVQGRFIMPGLFDAHVHPVLGGTEILLQCLFPTTATPAEVEETLSSCVAETPDAEWIIGGRWDSNFFINNSIGSPREWLDAISGDIAVSLADDTGHNRWVNSKALELAGMTRDYSVEGGEALRDDDGELNGILLESAMYPVLGAIPPLTRGQYLTAARQSIQTANRFGITGIKEAGDANAGIIAYKTLEREGALTVHMATSIAIPLKSMSLELDIDRLNQLRNENRGRNLDTDHVKIFMDGVPSVARTAAMIDDYLPDENGETHNGRLLVPEEVVYNWIQTLDAMGITVNLHTAGDRSVRVSLDAIENARRVNGDSGLMHQLAHAGFIDPLDIPRFAELGAVADISPAIWYPSPIVDSIVDAIGERGERYWPVKSLLDANAHVITGSDWPAVIPDMNPWPGIEALVTREHPWEEFPGKLWAEQAVSLEQALDLYVTSGARLLGIEAETGSLEIGKLADIIVLNQNLFEIPIGDVSDTTVALTMFEGNIVHGEAAF